MFYTLLTREDTCYLYSPCKFVLKHLQHLFNNFACSGYAYFHNVMRIVLQITQITKRKTTETGKNICCVRKKESEVDIYTTHEGSLGHKVAIVSLVALSQQVVALGKD